MPENARVAAYAAGASLVAATLAYIFGPSLWDVGPSRSRRKGIVGIRNPGNDCFINSVLQALAAPEALSVFLAAEVEERRAKRQQLSLQQQQQQARDQTSSSDDVTSNSQQDDDDEPDVEDRKAALLKQGLEEGWVTEALKEVLDALNERPLYQKNISNLNFIRTLEAAFATRISRRQQDAQEFLQIVAERILDEHQALKKFAAEPAPVAQQRPASAMSTTEYSSVSSVSSLSDISSALDTAPLPANSPPFEGQLESQVECQTCHFKPKPSVSTFVCLTLHVPQRKSTTLDECLDGLLKQEFIDDYVCDRCRLEHALAAVDAALTPSSSATSSTSSLSSSTLASLTSHRAALHHALLTNPESPPPGLLDPSISSTPPPRRRITKHTRIRRYPRLLAVHLSRSIFVGHSAKNTAPVTFAEDLRLGGFERRDYRLACLITHVGGHNSGHYETFRRQHVDPPPVPPSDAPNEKPTDETQIEPQNAQDERQKQREAKRRARAEKRWWRISDDRIGQCHVGDMLHMKREAYILIYELVAEPVVEEKEEKGNEVEGEKEEEKMGKD